MPITNLPYPYTLDTRHDNPPWHMDAIHIQQLYRLCERIRPRVVVEVGSYMGASTSAFAEARRDGLIDNIVCYEIKPHKELWDTLSMAVRDGEEVTPCTVLPYPYPEHPQYADLILIDADHEHGAVLDTLAALCMGCPHIVMHDSNAINLGLGCSGVDRAVKLLKASSRPWEEDVKKRPGMWTHRGLFYSWDDAVCGWEEGDLP